jgi:hypothetical protein
LLIDSAYLKRLVTATRSLQGQQLMIERTVQVMTAHNGISPKHPLHSLVKAIQ